LYSEFRYCKTIWWWWFV